MGSDSTIAWTNHTYNPWIGCTNVGVGCEGCYAEAYDRRFPADAVTHWGPGAPRRRTSEATRNAPIRWNTNAFKAGVPAKVFSHSLSDVFDNEVPQEWREEEFAMWRRTPWLRWIVLTKRPGNIPKMLPRDWHPAIYRNVGFCCSVSTQEEYDREIPKLLQVDAAWLGVSIEPQVEHIDIARIADATMTFNPLTGEGEHLLGFRGNARRIIDWIITGGASAQPGYDVPAYNADWARSIISQCAEADVDCFVKQLGSNAWDGDRHLDLAQDKGDDPEEWPADIWVREFPSQLTT